MDEVKIYTLAELEEKLTDKERIFCHEYIIDWNGSRAAREAGYSEKSAKEIGSQNLTKIHIKQYIAYIKDDIEKEAGISKLKVVNGLRDIAFAPTIDAADVNNQIKALQELKKAMGYDEAGKHNLTIKSGITDEDRDEIIKSLKND